MWIQTFKIQNEIEIEIKVENSNEFVSQAHHTAQYLGRKRLY